MKSTRLAFLAALTLSSMTAANAQTHVNMATATPGGGFPLFGDNAAAVINETDTSLAVKTHNTKGSGENIVLLEQGKMDVALVAGEPAYEAFTGIGRTPTHLKIISATYSNPGMFAVKLGQPIPPPHSAATRPSATIAGPSPAFSR